jgi:hypothetical protein
MKHVKMLGLAAMAAAALMAFVGASTASATVLCKTSTTTTCPAGWALAKGEKLHAVLEPEKIATLTGERPEHTTEKVITCTSSTVEGEVTNAGSATETAKGNITVLTFTGCTSPSTGGGKCTVTTLKGGTLEAHATSGGNGTLTSSGAEVTTSCESIFGNIHCIFTTNNANIGNINGTPTTGKTATFKAFEVPLTQVSTSVLCPEKAGWDGEYEVTTPDTLSVTAS